MFLTAQPVTTTTKQRVEAVRRNVSHSVATLLGGNSIVNSEGSRIYNLNQGVRSSVLKATLDLPASNSTDTV